MFTLGGADLFQLLKLPHIDPRIHLNLDSQGE
jgi:hypothetical protein